VNKLHEQFFLRAIFVGCEQFFADVSSKIIALADPVLSQPDMEWEMVSPPVCAYIPSFTLPPIAGPSRNTCTLYFVLYSA
jgi:hypothetical protein